jgi:ubiquinone/menaquinone biosynthesis C-methylase UbiE
MDETGQNTKQSSSYFDALKSETKEIKYFQNFHDLNYSVGRKRDQILSKSMELTTSSFLHNSNIREGMSGVDLGCSMGDVTLKLKSFVGENGKMLGIGLNATHIKIAKETVLDYLLTGVDFIHEELNDWEEVEVFDFAYSRLLLNRIDNPLTFLNQVYKSLRKGGFVMIEEMDISSLSCFPSCYAINRFKELIQELSIIQSGDITVGQHLFSILNNSQFENIQVQIVKPVFLIEGEKHLPSLTLEFLSKSLFENRLISVTELHALMIELKTFENRQDTLISIPGIYQVRASKSREE